MLCDALEQKAFDNQIELYSIDFVDNIDGIIIDNTILLSKNLISNYKYNRVVGA